MLCMQEKMDSLEKVDFVLGGEFLLPGRFGRAVSSNPWQQEVFSLGITGFKAGFALSFYFPGIHWG